MPDRKANIPERPCLRAVQAEPEHYSHRNAAHSFLAGIKGDPGSEAGKTFRRRKCSPKAEEGKSSSEHSGTAM